MKLKITNDLVNHVIVFLILFLSVSFVVTNDIISSPMTIALWLFVLVLILALNNWKPNVPVKLLVVTIALLALMFVTNTIRGEDIVSNVKIYFSVVTVMLCICTISFQKFCECFVKIIKLLCVISLIGYLMFLVFPGFYSIFQMSGWWSNHANLILYVQHLENIIPRNYGFAWEPGAFVILICLAMLFDVFVVSSKISLKSLLLYLITVFTTMSTTGMIATFFFLLYMVMFNRRIDKRLKQIFIFISVCIIIAIIVFFDGLFDTSKPSVFGKLINYLNGYGANDEVLSSTETRVNAIVYVFLAFLERPFFGWGNAGLVQRVKEYTNGVNTCTFINFFAIYGIFFGSLMIFGICKLCKKIIVGNFNQFVIFVFLFLITISENYASNPIIFVLAFYGFSFSEFIPPNYIHSQNSEIGEN